MIWILLYSSYPEKPVQKTNRFKDYWNSERYHKSLENLTPADACFGWGGEILRPEGITKTQNITDKLSIKLEPLESDAIPDLGNRQISRLTLHYNLPKGFDDIQHSNKTEAGITIFIYYIISYFTNTIFFTALKSPASSLKKYIPDDNFVAFQVSS